MAAFTYEFRDPEPPAKASWEMVQALTGFQKVLGYKLTQQTDSGITLQRDYRPWWAYVLLVLTFPIGLLFLLVRRSDVVTIRFAPEGTGSRVLVTGTDDRTREMFEGIDQPPPTQ